MGDVNNDTVWNVGEDLTIYENSEENQISSTCDMTVKVLWTVPEGSSFLITRNVYVA